MKTKDTNIAGKATEELVLMLAAEMEKVRAGKFAQGMTRTKDVKAGRTSKKLIAQIKTELASRA